MKKTFLILCLLVISFGYSKASNFKGIKPSKTKSVVAGPEIDVRGNSVSIVDGDTTPSTADWSDFGTVTITRAFLIRNSGDAPLTIGAITFTGTNASEFSVTTLPSNTVAALSSTTFVVTFTPITTGLKTATINIVNNDSNENPYDFKIQATGTAPEIDIQGNATSIVDGDTTPSTTDWSDFSSVATTRTFTITNTGNMPLTLGAITISGTNASEFSVTTSPNATVAPLGNTTLVVAFAPTALGVRSATISIINNDSNENPYDFKIQGTGTAPEIDIQGNATTIVDGDTTPSTFDWTDFGATFSTRTFTLRNTGTLPLTVGAITFTGTNASEFSVTASPTAIVTGINSTSFVVTFTPTAFGGVRTAKINVVNNDSNENPYDFNIQGQVLAPAITSFTPTSGCANTTITITGTDFRNVSAVTVGGINVGSFTVNSATTITATIGAAPTGLVSVIATAGTATSASNFTIAPPGAPYALAQSFCSATNPKVSNLEPSGPNYIWYATASNGSALSTATPLATGTYYVSFTNGVCEGTRTAVAVTLYTPTAPNISYAGVNSIYYTGTSMTPLNLTNSGATPSLIQTQVSTLAGNNYAGFVDGIGTSAQFYNPWGIAIDNAGNIYVADEFNHSIRKVTPSGVVTTLAGNGIAGSANGNGAAAQFRNPIAVAVDSAGNVYVADSINHKIRKITPSGDVTDFAGSGVAGFANGLGSAAQFFNPLAIAADNLGNVYVADGGNNPRIRKIEPNGLVSTLAGSGTIGAADGNGTAAQFGSYPQGLAVDGSRNVFVADIGNNVIRKIAPSGIVSTYAGSTGFGFPVNFLQVTSVAVDALGNLYVGDPESILKISPTGVVTKLSEQEPLAEPIPTFAYFDTLNGVAVAPSGDVYFAGTGNKRIRKIVSQYYSITPNLPAGLTFNVTTGTISGMPTVVSPTTTYTISTQNECITNSTNITFATALPNSVIQLKLFLEGFYKASGLMQSVKFNQDGISSADEVEDVTIELHDPNTYALMATSVGTLHTNGNVTATFAPISGSFYIAVKGNNVIQTWTAQPQTVGTAILNYDFTTAASKAYDNNMKEVASGVWAFYQGDVTGDDSIDLSDASTISMDSDGSAYGILATDVTGDGSVDLSDVTIVSENSDGSRYAKYPF